jgi:hypothetical protein
MMGVRMCVCVRVCVWRYVCVCVSWHGVYVYTIRDRDRDSDDMMYVCTCSTRGDQHGLLKCLELFLTSNIRKSCCCTKKITWQREYLFEIIKICLKTVSQTRTTVTPLFKLEPSVSLAVGLPSSSVPPRTSDNTVFFILSLSKKDWKLNLNVWNHTARAGLAEKTTLPVIPHRAHRSPSPRAA